MFLVEFFLKLFSVTIENIFCSYADVKLIKFDVI